MIPPDVANSLRQMLPDSSRLESQQTQPVTPAQKLGDVLSNLVPGQRVMAEIQAMLPNGSYRALVAQREITLALPFSAKAGDSLELEVVETDGKVSLAYIGGRTASGASSLAENSVATTLSQAGKLIGNLLGDVDNMGKRAAPAMLNGNQPLVDDFPVSAADLAPILKDALGKSGVFYEAHQARWVAGQLPTRELLNEPQGRHSQLRDAATEALSEGQANKPRPENQAAVSSGREPLADQGSMATRTPAGSIPAELTSLVQQQLDALATQNFAWHGQIWPGQQMFWEIDDKQDGARNNDGETAGQWQTRLKLNLPQLGNLEATLRLRSGNEVDISLSAERNTSEQKLSIAATQLKEQFEAAGLSLTQFAVKHGTPAE